MGLAALAAFFGFVAACGDYDSHEPNGAAGSAGQSVAGAAGTASAGRGGTGSAGASSAGAASGGVSAGSSPGGSSGSGGGDFRSGGGAAGEAGAAGSGGSGSRSECNPTKVTCKALPPECPASQVPSVEGSCWGDCVEITQCACAQTSDCPNNDEYFCWDEQHCGPIPK